MSQNKAIINEIQKEVAISEYRALVSQSNLKQFAVEIANQIKTQQLLDKSTSVVATCSTRGSRTAPVASTPSAGKQVLL